MAQGIVAFLALCFCVDISTQHGAYPPGVPPPNNAHVHAPPAHQGGQQQYQGQQQFQGQQQQQFQGHQQQQFQGQQNQQFQGQQQQFQQHQQGQQQNLQYQQGQHPGQQGQGQFNQGNTQQFQQPGGHQAAHGGFGHESAHDAGHIKEHLKEVVDKPKEEMSEDELEFHYFKLHDYDKNNKLDGIEIVKAITHFHADEGEGEQQHHDRKVFSDEELSNIVDLVLQEDDLNKDGYIEYVEFVTAQRKAREQAKTDQGNEQQQQQQH
ncbi:sex-determining region Y protein-like isoform X2 [Saccostrea cucullata]|uniref:sex-determining region Y protein-like isoform X2 n=1 Tax=Saccostrea cuccullata TaxID=36930 RepID=UPI002ED14363